MNYKTKGVATSTVGYMLVAISGWMLSMSSAGWYSHTIGVSFLLGLAIVLAVMGILAFEADRGLDAVVFFGGTAIMGTIFAYEGMVATTHVAQPLSYIGWFAAMWAIYYCCTWVGSLRSGFTRSGFLLGLWLTLGVLAIGGWTGVGDWLIAGGYLGLITSVLAFVTAGSEIIHYGVIANPNLEVPGTTTGTAHPMAAD